MRTGTKVRLTVICVCVVVGMVGCAVMLFGQTIPSPPKEYKLTELQFLKLQVQQKDALLLQAQMRSIEQAYQGKVSELMSTANKVKLENGWPPETQFDPDKLVFSAPPTKEEKK